MDLNEITSLPTTPLPTLVSIYPEMNITEGYTESGLKSTTFLFCIFTRAEKNLHLNKWVIIKYTSL